jgi:dsRNA-specific ribonuclease
MVYDYLLKDINQNLSQKIIGTNKGLAKIGDELVNFTYSVAKSIYLTKHSANSKVILTSKKVGKIILANALKEANMKQFAKNRADAHDLADTVEAIMGYIWLSKKMDIEEIINFLASSLEGDLNNRNEEIKQAEIAFAKLLNHIKPYLPEKEL